MNRMLFAGLPFLFYFLPIVMILYLSVPSKCKNLVLLLSSLCFYAWGEPKYVFLMCGEILFTYGMGLLIGRFVEKKKAVNILTAFSSVVLLLALAYFKYADFAIGNFNLVIKNIEPAWEMKLLGIALPIGISFYTFQAISYLVDVKRAEAPAQKNILSLATYISLFPQLIAGPIVRYTQVEQELSNRKINVDEMGEGSKRFLYGLGKKVLLANTLGELVALYEKGTGATVLFTWVYVLAVSLQIYFDFSGYSDMAIGLGRMLGFHFPENFNYPFESTSVTEFWRRWHMTLGSWFRDYLYIPLGGNRCSVAKHIRNITIVWFATGLWHGASWNFVLWGIYFAIFLLLEKYVFGRRKSSARKEFKAEQVRENGDAVKAEDGVKDLQKQTEVGKKDLQKQTEVGTKDLQKQAEDGAKSGSAGLIFGEIGKHIYLCFVIMVSFLIFHQETLNSAFAILGRMFGQGTMGGSDAQSMYYLRSYGVLLVISILGATSLPKRLMKRMAEKETGFLVLSILEIIFLAGIFVVSVACLVNGSYNPFLYFRF